MLRSLPEVRLGVVESKEGGEGAGGDGIAVDSMGSFHGFSSDTAGGGI